MRHFITSILLLAASLSANAQAWQTRLRDWAAYYTRTDANIKPSTLIGCTVNDTTHTVSIEFGGGFPEQHFLPIVVDTVYRAVRALLPPDLRNHTLTIIADGRPIGDLVPNFFRTAEQQDTARLPRHTYNGTPWVTNTSRPYTAPLGLEGRHIALWQSHGRYYKQEKQQWIWQRPRLFCTTEDLFSQTFVVPFIIPMLQNAGACVFTPRERDYQTYEVIVDNDQPQRDGIYIESFRRKNRRLKWQTAPSPAFAHYKEIYAACDSPFVDGTARYASTTSSDKDEGTVQWIPDLPAEGRYAVYVTYQTLGNDAISDAAYTVHHKGGSTTFRVNQQMGGGTWVYLGTFDFDAGEHDYGMVTLSTASRQHGLVSADAVRFGGGMGNIVPENGFDYGIRPSGMPRWAEAAKYSTQWMGFPYSIHTQPFGSNDYNNDINSRSASVNYLSGGSISNPSRTDGLHVPLDLTVAFHTDAGVRDGSECVGPLAIYMTNFLSGRTGAGLDRYVSRDLASMFLSNMVTDLASYNWPVRQLWNRNYGEAREPRTPACIVEMLSHQNFADMRLAYDPHFKFQLSRSIYKTIVKFMATQQQRDYVIQPLPVQNFNISLGPDGTNTATLRWSPVDDPLEPTAKPTSYIVYTRRGYGSFDNGTLVRSTQYSVKLQPNEVYSFKITAVNKGGESFPSETLACGIAPNNKGTVLIVNAFDRLSGPRVIDTPTQAGFDIDADPGVPYGAYTGFCGRQLSFDRSKNGVETSGGLGYSDSNLEGSIVMGNTFDYASIHGHAIMLAGGHSFTSCSEQALLAGSDALDKYPAADIIYGTQLRFSPITTAALQRYYAGGGRLLLSAAGTEAPAIGGTVSQSFADKSQPSIVGCGLTFDIYRQPNPDSYCVPAPSVLTPEGEGIFPILTYADGTYAGIAQLGRLVRLGFPLESITDRHKLNALTGAFLKFLFNN